MDIQDPADGSEITPPKTTMRNATAAEVKASAARMIEKHRKSLDKLAR